MTESYLDATAQVIDCELMPSVKIYKEALVKNCVLDANTIVGDFSRIEDSHLSEHVTLQRNNLAYNVRIGRYTYTGKNCTMWHCSIGAFCSISWNVSIGGANHDYNRITTHSFLYSPNFGLMENNEPAYDRFTDQCEIGNDVWIGCNAVICRGAHIGDGAVIGAGAVVTRDIEPYTIAVGSPARPLKKRFADELIDRLQKTEWWNLPANIITENFKLFSSIANAESIEKLETIVSQAKIE